jgi:hypothetical protein
MFLRGSSNFVGISCTGQPRSLGEPPEDYTCECADAGARIFLRGSSNFAEISVGIFL